MSNRAEIIITLNAKGQREVQAAFGGVRKEAGELNNSVGVLGRGASGLATTFSRVLGPAVAGLGLVTLGKQMVDVSAKFQTLNASLITVTGSQAAANENFAWLQDFAAETPFQLDQVVGAFIKMESLGLNPTREALTSFGNTASAMGKNLNQMIEAVADASVGEFERLKEFGIKARSEGDNIKFTFNGVTTTIKKDAADITKYLQQLGDTKFAGGMSRQMDTIGGSMSNLSDSWDYFLVSLGKTGPIDAAADSFNTLSTALRNFGQSFELFKAYQDGKIGFWDFLTANPEDAKKLLEQTAGMDAQLIKLQNTVKELKSDKAGNFWWSAADESELQQAQQALEFYKLSLGDIDRLKQAALSNTFVPTDITPDQKKWEPNADTVALGIAAGNNTEEDMWLKRVGLDAGAIEREKTARLEIRQWRREQDLIEAQMMTDNWALRDEGMSPAVDRELEILEQQAQERVRIEEEANAMILNMKQSNINSALGLMMMFTGKSKALALAALVVQKGLAMAETFIVTQTAAAAALAPPPLGLGPILGAPVAAAVETQGYIRMGLIAATGLAQAALSGGGGGNYGGGTPSSPTITAPQPTAFPQTPDANNGRTVNVTILGGAVFGEDRNEMARRLKEAIDQAEKDGY